jgi:hypothetical protein
MSFLSELKRRNVLRVGIAYLAGAWLLIQIADTLFPVFELPNSSMRAVVIVLGVGFIPAMILAWAFELTPGGFAPDRGAATPARRCNYLSEVTIRLRMPSMDFLRIRSFSGSVTTRAGWH